MSKPDSIDTPDTPVATNVRTSAPPQPLKSLQDALSGPVTAQTDQKGSASEGCSPPPNWVPLAEWFAGVRKGQDVTFKEWADAFKNQAALAATCAVLLYLSDKLALQRWSLLPFGLAWMPLAVFGIGLVAQALALVALTASLFDTPRARGLIATSTFVLSVLLVVALTLAASHRS